MTRGDQTVLAFCPEVELLLCCARTRMDSARVGTLRAIVKQGLDWEYLLRTARFHGIMPLLYRHLMACCPEHVPKSVRHKLHEHFDANTRQSLILTVALLKLLQLFKANDIPAISFKGPVLAAHIYGDVGLRQFTDLDILVQRKDFLRAYELLVSQGFRPLSQPPSMRNAAFFQCEHSFVNDSTMIFVDLHWAIEPTYLSFAPDPEVLWERPEFVELGGQAVLTLASHDLLVILCSHGARHGWGRLFWICDVAELVSSCGQMDWSVIMEESLTFGRKKMMTLGLSLASNLLDANLPEEVREKLRSDKAAGALARQVCDRLFQEPSSTDLILEERRFYLRTMDRLRDRLKHLYDQFLTPTPGEWELLPLPASLFFLYYPLRPLRLAVKYALSPFRSARHAFHHG